MDTVLHRRGHLAHGLRESHQLLHRLALHSHPHQEGAQLGLGGLSAKDYPHGSTCLLRRQMALAGEGFQVGLEGHGYDEFQPITHNVANRSTILAVLTGMSFRILVVGLSSAVLLAQTAPQRATFEAASVKPNNSGSNSSSTSGTLGQMVIVNQSLKRLIERAYEVPPIQVVGPEWLENVRFDVSAKNPPNLKREDRGPMMQALLEERFKLQVHRETKEFSGFGLVPTKSGFKLKPVEPGDMSSNSNGNGTVTTLSVKKASLAAIANMVGRALEQPVVDKTGIDGVYDFEIRYTRDDREPNGSDADAVPGLSFAIQEVLGLRLQRQKVPLTVIVVDHVERTPTEN
jgi:uncharacterized protein (TIGR03435 family)